MQCAWGVNNSGQVVGLAYTVDEAQHAFLWEQGVMYDLHDLLVDGPGREGWGGDMFLVEGKNVFSWFPSPNGPQGGING